LGEKVQFLLEYLGIKRKMKGNRDTLREERHFIFEEFEILEKDEKGIEVIRLTGLIWYWRHGSPDKNKREIQIHLNEKERGWMIKKLKLRLKGVKDTRMFGQNLEEEFGFWITMYGQRLSVSLKE
jgi:hypothetical protein